MGSSYVGEEWSEAWWIRAKGRYGELERWGNQGIALELRLRDTRHLDRQG